MFGNFALPKLDFRWSVPIFYAALFSAFGIYLPFMPVWLASRGLEAWQISLCLSLPMLSRILTPLSGLLADRAQKRRNVIMALLGLALGFGIALQMASGFLAILLLLLAFNFVWNPVMPITEAFAVHEAEKRGADYGRWRVWGSASFVVFNVAGGLILTDRPAAIILPLLLILLGFAAFAARLLPPSGGARAGQVRFADLGRLIAQKGLMRFMLAAGLIQASHGFYYSFSSVYWVAQDYSGWIIGLLWATGVLAETVLFYVAGRVTGSIYAVKLVLIGGFCASLRWLLMGFEPPLGAVFVLQSLHAASFALTHLGTMKFIRQQVSPDLAATGQGLFTAISAGLLTGIVMFISGPIYEALGGHGFWVMGLFSVSGILLLFSPKVRRVPAT